ncbi:tumor necrosis factor ligand superfamily member 10-like [Polyodon spathula]|uniref:tumor necrosis factor ligand superfamily member 10-like n=1 Tax=Polyodon spathula TaxID=7913 RepID=UPI001B7EBFB1|nr:tumor necrosis factor ligand superfamily member 10-like [Polyodon spathula]
MANENNQDYFRSNSNDSKTYMIIPTAKRENDTSSKLSVVMVVVVVIVLQIACTTALFVYFNMSISQTKNQGVTEELKCLKLLNKLEDTIAGGQIPEEVRVFMEPCMKVADSIKSYIAKVTEHAIRRHLLQEARNLPRSFNTSDAQFVSEVTQRPSAHLSLRDVSHQPHDESQSNDLHQSCRHPIRTWDTGSFGSHIHNMSLNEGWLKVTRNGRYYLYSQVYFRYPTDSSLDPHNPAPESHSSHQLVQCIYKKTSYLKPILLLKGVGTKCWAEDAEYALHSVYQGGLFELRSGDKVFVSVSSVPMVYADETSSYFGAFQLDL